jgi:alpha-tubulin suppressor-like RCC1 family protein
MDYAMPQVIMPGTTFTDVAIAWQRDCTIAGDRLVRCSGYSEYGALGLGPPDMIREHVTMTTTVPPFEALEVSGGGHHACAVGADRGLYCWGTDDYGQSASETEDDVLSPMRVGTAEWIDVTASEDHSCGIQQGGSLWCWGRNESGQLGLGYRGDSLDDRRRRPTAVAPGFRFSRVRSADTYTCAIRDDGALFCWGTGAMGELALGPAVVESLIPSRVCLPP